ncbi:MAG: hypothetical protein R3E95_06945 [Thiolinea sp.]
MRRLHRLPESAAPVSPLPEGIRDGRHRFREIYRIVQADHGDEQAYDRSHAEALRQFADELPPPGKGCPLGGERLPLHYLLIPGLGADCLSHKVSPFNIAREHLHARGFRSSILWVNGRSSSDYNAAMIRTHLQQTGWGTERLVLLGYSKGVVDALQAVTDYPEIRERIAAVVSVAGAVWGSPLVEMVPRWLQRLFSTLSLWGCRPGDGRSLVSLHPQTRRSWFAQHRLPEQIRYFSLPACPEPERVSRILRRNYRQLAAIDKNDSQVIWRDALIPGSELLGYANADHWAVTLPLTRRWPHVRHFVNHNDYPREILLESIVRYVEESLLEG